MRRLFELVELRAGRAPVLQFRDHGSEQHGAAQRAQNVVGLDDQGGRRVLLQPLESGEQFREDVFLGGEIDTDLVFLGGEIRQCAVRPR